MTRSNLLLALLPLTSILLTGCGERTHDAIVQEFIESTGKEFTNCGAHEIPSACGAPSAAIAEANTCLVEGFTACKPVRLDVTQRTVEGDPVFTTFLVVPQGDRCFVEMFTDARQDRFGDGEAHQSRCEAVQAAESCPWIAADACHSACEQDTDCG
jgi:hypothetical protein